MASVEEHATIEVTVDERKPVLRLRRVGTRVAQTARRMLAAVGTSLVTAYGGPEHGTDAAYAPKVVATYAPVEDQVDEGVMIAAAGVRLSVKNLLITRALRDHEDFDLGWYLDAIGREFRALADEKARDAERVAEVSAVAAQRSGRPTRIDDFRTHDVQHLDVREQIARLLGDRLLAASEDERFLRTQLELAQGAAVDEFRRAVTSRLIVQTAGDADYERERDARLELLDSDIALLALQRQGL